MLSVACATLVRPQISDLRITKCFRSAPYPWKGEQIKVHSQFTTDNSQDVILFAFRPTPSKFPAPRNLSPLCSYARCIRNITSETPGHKHFSIWIQKVKFFIPGVAQHTGEEKLLQQFLRGYKRKLLERTPCNSSGGKPSLTTDHSPLTRRNSQFDFCSTYFSKK